MKIRALGKRKLASLFAAAAITLCCNTAMAQSATALTQTNLRKWNIPPANYSGITHVEGNSYAVVSDKEARSGFYIFDIDIDNRNGKIRNVSRSALYAAETSANGRDEEGVCYFAPGNTLFISAEDDQKILEYDLDGKPTGRKLNVPAMFSPDSIYPNFGFESLAYDSASSRFFAATERPLKCDALNDSAVIRILIFDQNLNPSAQYAYMLESPSLNSKAKYYAHGISEIAALTDGRILVMEREISVPANYIGAECRIRLFVVDLSEGNPIVPANVPLKSASHKPLYKTAIADFTTHLNFGQMNLANYEGMCLGPKLKDGRQTLLLINDSQAGAGNSLYHLKDYIKVIIL